MKAFFVLVSLMLFTFSPIVAAQGPLLPGADELYEDWYNVELIVFAQNRANHGVPAPGLVEPQISTALELDRLFEEQMRGVAVEEPATPRPPSSGFAPLPISERQLTDVYQRLEASSSYQPIVHAGWRQLATPYREARAVRIQGGEILDRRQKQLLDQHTADESLPANDPWPRVEMITTIDGTAKLSLGNEPQLLLDLIFRTRDTFNPLRNISRAYQSQDEQHFNTWHLREHRAMDTGELQYFDHRRFGVVALVTPWQPVTDNLNDPTMTTSNATTP